MGGSGTVASGDGANLRSRGMRRGVICPNVGDPSDLLDFAREVESLGWDGLFVWDHVQMYAAEGLELLDPWVLLTVVASGTEKLDLGAMVTPISRRRPWKLAKELVSLDLVSDGRVIIGIGLGGPEQDEFAAFGDDSSAAERAERTDEALPLLDQFLRGEPVDHTGKHYEAHAHLHPASFQSPRPPIWIAGTPPFKKPLERAARWDGVFCNAKITTDYMPLTPDELGEYAGDLVGRENFDVITMRHPDHDEGEYEDAGATHLAEGFFPRKIRTGTRGIADRPDWLQEFREQVRSRAS